MVELGTGEHPVAEADPWSLMVKFVKDLPGLTVMLQLVWAFGGLGIQDI
jgi:hypothetical protein